MSKAAAQRLAPKVTVTHERNAPVTLAPKKDPVQSAWGNGVASTIVFTDPLVVTAGPPKAEAKSGAVEAETEISPAPASQAAPKDKADDGDVIEFEPELITAKVPDDAQAPDALAAESAEKAEPAEVAKAGAEAASEEAPAEEEEAAEGQVEPEEEAEGEGEAAEEEIVEPEQPKEVKPPGAAAGGGGGDGAADLAAWKSRVTGATQTVPQPTLGPEPAARVTVIAGAGKGAAAKHKAAGGALAKEAEKAVRKPPETPKPIPPPPKTPVPEADQLIAGASDKKLPDQELPALERRPSVPGEPESTVPVMDTDFAKDMGSKIELPPPEPAPELAPGEKKPADRQQLDKLKDAKGKTPEENRKAQPGEKMVLQDTAAPPAPTLETGTKGQSKEKVAQVLAELLRSPGAEGAADEIIKEARREAFPRDVLEKWAPTMGDDQKTPVLTELQAQVASIRAIAGITQAELDVAIKAREETVKKLAEGVKIDADAAKEDARTETEAAGDKAAEDIAGAREAMDEKTIQTAIAANGEADPAVIELRRDKGIRDLTRRTARQDVFYEKAGERRGRALDSSHMRMRDAYAKAAIADRKPTYDRMLAEELKANVAKDATDEAAKKARETAEEAAKKRANAVTASISEWAAHKTQEIGKIFVKLKDQAAAKTKEYRDGIKLALDGAKEKLHAWAEDLIARQEGWWDSLVRKFNQWMKEAQDDSAAWEEARNEQLRDTLVGDMAMIDDLTALAQSGADLNAHLATRGLDQAQLQIVQTYFAGSGPEGKKQLDAIGAVAAGMRLRVKLSRKPGLIEWFKNHVMSLPDSEWELLGWIGNAENSSFDVVVVDSELFAAMDQWGTDEDKVYKALAGLTPVQGRAVRAFYQKEHGRSLDSHLKSEMEDEELERAEAALTGNPVVADVAALNEAMSGAGTNEDTIMQVLRGKTAEQRAAIVAEYKKRYGRDLEADLKSELDDGWSSHHDFDRANALMAGDTAKADAIALDSAMSGAGTDEAAITRIYEQNRAEIEAEAARKGWTTAEMEAELKKRNDAIEKQYESKYGDPNRPKDQPSALRAAFKSELSDAEHGLAEALASGDMTAIDSAKLGVEKQSFITDDETVNNILASQAQRARKDVERDANVELQFKAEVDAMRGDAWDHDRWTKERTDAKADIEKKVKDRSMLYMSNLETAFDKDWGGKGGLVVMLAFNMSGDESKKGFQLLNQGGVLTPEQEIYYAVNGPGTDVDKLKQVLKGKSKDDIDKLKKVWADKYPDEGPLDERIMEEVGGNDAREMQWGLEGEPQSIDEQVARAKERKDYYKGAKGWWGKYEREDAAMEREYKSLVKQADKLKELEGLKGSKREGESEEAYLARLERYAYYEDAYNLKKGSLDRTIEDHEKAVNEFADTAATIAGIVAVVAVMVVVGAFTGGTGAAAIGAALASAKVAAAAAVAGALATVGTKMAIKGKAYSNEELAVDVIVGAIDAVASAMTAGVGGGMLKAARAGVPASKLAGIAAKSRLAAGLSKMAASERMAARMFAGAMAEGVEGVVSSLPSALAGNVLDEKNWTKGNPLLNIVKGTVIQTGIGAVVSGGMGALGGISKNIDPPKTGDVLAKRGTPGERLVKWKSWQVDNPGKPYNQFLEQLDAGLIAKDVDDSARKAMQREMRKELLAEIPETQRKQFAGVPIEVMADADFDKFTRSASGQAVVIFKDGKPMVILREGADIKALREEGIHLVQSKDPKWAKKFKRLDEARLANWEKLPLDEQLSLYRTKLDIEIDAQQRLLKNLDDQLAGIDDPALRKSLLARRDAAAGNLDNLTKRLGDVDNFPAADKLKIARKEMKPPQYLDQKPRLFSKDGTAVAKKPPAPRIESKKVIAKLGGEAADETGLRDFSMAVSNYVSGKKGKGAAVRSAAVQFVRDIIDIGAGSNAKALSLLRSALGLFESVTVPVIAPFLRHATDIAKSLEILGSVGDTLFDNLQRIAASGTFGITKIPKIASALDEIMAAADSGAAGKADNFVREVRKSVESWNDYQKQLKAARDLLRSGGAGDAVKAANDLANRLKGDFDIQLARLDGFEIKNAQVLADIKKEVQNTGKWEWKKFRVQQGKDFAQPTSFAKLEQLITTMAALKNWDPADIGPIRRWAGVLEKLDETLEGAPDGPNLKKFFDDLAQPGSPFEKLFAGRAAALPKGTPQQKLMLGLGQMFKQFEAGYKAGAYDKLRYFIRDAVIASAMDQPNAGKQFAFIQSFLDKLRKFDSASVGEYFSAFRRAILEGPDDLPARGSFTGVKGLPDAKRALKAGQKGRMADGAATVGRDLSDTGPFAGSRTLIEDKAGKSSDDSQVLNYSDIFKASEKEILDANPNPAGKLKPPSIPTADGDFHSVTYFCESLAEAKKKAEHFDRLGIHWAIQLAAFDPATGALVMVPRPRVVMPEPGKLNAYKEWLKPPQ